jgi:flagellar biosynthesis protein FliQ
MVSDQVVDMFRQGVFIAIMMILVLVMPGLIVGFVVAMFQAATQINESSLSFVPKILVTLLAIVMAGPWLVGLIVSYTERLFTDIPSVIG